MQVKSYEMWVNMGRWAEIVRAAIVAEEMKEDSAFAQLPEDAHFKIANGTLQFWSGKRSVNWIYQDFDSDESARTAVTKIMEKHQEKLARFKAKGEASDKAVADFIKMASDYNEGAYPFRAQVQFTTHHYGSDDEEKYFSGGKIAINSLDRELATAFVSSDLYYGKFSHGNGYYTSWVTCGTVEEAEKILKWLAERCEKLQCTECDGSGWCAGQIVTGKQMQ